MPNPEKCPHCGADRVGRRTFYECGTDVSGERTQMCYEREIAAPKKQIGEIPVKCKCTLSQRLMGGGCDICNPALAYEHACETIADQEKEIAALRKLPEAGGVAFGREVIDVHTADEADNMAWIPKPGQTVIVLGAAADGQEGRG